MIVGLIDSIVANTDTDFALGRQEKKKAKHKVKMQSIMVAL
jgi:hypothetical protein